MRKSPLLTRTQRRTERRQVALFLVLVLGVALGSFVLGVLVGRNVRTVSRDEREAARMPIVRPPASPMPSIDGEADRLQPGSPSPAQSPAAVPAPSPAQLTFYDALPKGEKPLLGSGINLPGGGAVAATSADLAATAAAVAAPSPRPAAVSRPDPKPTVASPAAAASAKKIPATPGSGTFIVQVASLPREADATVLSKRLQRKGYPVFVDSSEVKGKGTWFRVCVGPYDQSDVAKAATERLRLEERLAPILRKR